VGMSFSSDNDAIAFVNDLQDKCPDQQLLLSGHHLIQLKDAGKLGESIMVFRDIPELIDFVNVNSGQPFMRKMA